MPAGSYRKTFVGPNSNHGDKARYQQSQSLENRVNQSGTRASAHVGPKSRQNKQAKPASVATAIRNRKTNRHDYIRKGLNQIHLDAPTYIRTGSKGDSVEETRRLLKR